MKDEANDIPQMNIMAEQKFLACLFQDTKQTLEVLERYRKNIKVDDFYKIGNRKVYELISESYTLHGEVRLQDVINLARDAGISEALGGTKSISKIATQEVHIDDLMLCVELITLRSVGRRLDNLAKSIDDDELNEVAKDLNKVFQV